MARARKSKITPKQVLVWTLVTGAVVVAVYFGGKLVSKKVIQPAKRKSVVEKMGTDPALEIATKFYNAFEPYSSSLNKWFGDGTDEELAYEAAADFGKAAQDVRQRVPGYFRDLTGKELVDAMKEELTGSELSKALSLMKPG